MGRIFCFVGILFLYLRSDYYGFYYGYWLMKILEAYYNTKVRSMVKRYLMAEGRKLSEVDRLYRQFGTYLSRLKSVGFYSRLAECGSEREFRELLRVLFEEKWVDHIRYTEMPAYFNRYLEYLHSACALDESLEVEGLEEPDEQSCTPREEVTGYARPYLRDGKLSIIANPLLIKRLRPLLGMLPMSMPEAVSVAGEFYGDLLPDMTGADWEALISELAAPLKPRSSKSTARFIEFRMADGSRKVLGGNDAFFYLVETAGVEALMRTTVTHKGDKVVTRNVDYHYENYYKPLPDGLWLNVKGSVTDKMKTLRVLASLLKLPYTVSLTNEKD